MKLNEIITESQLQEGPLLNKLGSAVGKGVGTLAKGAGAVAGGIAGIGSAFKKGFSAGRGTVAAAGDEPDAAAPTASAQPAADTGAQSKDSPKTTAPATTPKSSAPTAQDQPAAPSPKTPTPKVTAPAAEKEPTTEPQTATTPAAQEQPAANDTQYAQAQRAIAALQPADQKQILTTLQSDPKVKSAMAQGKAKSNTQAAAPYTGPNWDAETGAPLSPKAKAEYEKFTPAQKAEIEQNVKDAALFKKTGKDLEKLKKSQKKVSPSQAEIDADRARIMGPTSDSVIRKSKSIVENIDEAGLMAKLGTKVGQAAQAAGHVAGAAARGVDIAKNDPEHAAAMVRAFKTGQTEPVQQTAAKIQDPSGTVPAPIIDKLNQLTLEQRAELHKLLVQKTV